MVYITAIKPKAVLQVFEAIMPPWWPRLGFIPASLILCTASYTLTLSRIVVGV